MPGEQVSEEYRPDAYARTAASRLDRDAMLPALTDPYKAAGTADNGEVSRLVLVMGKDGFKPGATAYYLMQYVHIGLGEFGFDADGQFFRFVFSDIQPKVVTVRGRSLLRICDYIGLRRMPWIRQADRDFRLVDGMADGEPFITRIEVVDWVQPED
jgi:hypothetical protein